MSGATSETMRVRWAARGGAVLVAVLAGLIALKPFHAPIAGERDEAGVVSISVDISPVTPSAPVLPPPQPRVHGVEMANAAQPVADAAPGDTLDLWVDHSGHLLFNSSDKYRAYEHCLAVHGGHASPDCPSPTASDTNPPVVLTHRVSHGWH